jgi:hypothetical protein
MSLAEEDALPRRQVIPSGLTAKQRTPWSGEDFGASLRKLPGRCVRHCWLGVRFLCTTYARDPSKTVAEWAEDEILPRWWLREMIVQQCIKHWKRWHERAEYETVVEVRHHGDAMLMVLDVCCRLDHAFRKEGSKACLIDRRVCASRYDDDISVPSTNVTSSKLYLKYTLLGRDHTWQRARWAGVPTLRPCTGLKDSWSRRYPQTECCNTTHHSASEVSTEQNTNQESRMSSRDVVITSLFIKLLDADRCRSNNIFVFLLIIWIIFS